MLAFTGDSIPGANPLYHTRYDTFHILDEIIDRGFKTHRAVCQVTAEMARNLADSLTVPFNVSDLSEQLQMRVTILDMEYGQLLRTHGIHFEWLQEAAENFSSEVIKFQTRADNINMNDPFAIRRINDQLILLERAFIDPAGLPGRPLARHVLFSHLDVNSYVGTTFPGLVDSLLKLADASEDETKALWEVIKQHFSVLVFTIQSAQTTLREVTTFMPDFQETV
ncbi:N-acetylated-alpha-linked acidic dipeptidase 2-like [Mizuhopecten yessoensis]|nr:N-acetylated-alpha-linked acidic dipeptidase 2-like [Mizuhopecten yessoensis]